MAKIAIMGFGTVGSGVLEVCRKNAAAIARRAGEPVEVKYILDVRDFSDSPDAALFVKDLDIILADPEVKAECVVTEEPGGILEIKNIAVLPEEQRKGYGRRLIGFLLEHYAGLYTALQVGTGDSPSTVPFYEACGFRRHHLVKNFFTDNYDHPIYEHGVRLVDMVYLQRGL